MLTNGQTRKAERQKASIDRWNQEVVEPLDPGQQAGGGWSHDQRPPLPRHAYGSVEDQAPRQQQLSQDLAGSFRADRNYNPGHESSLSHGFQGAQSPARQCKPYDLSPAYLGSYADEPENPSSRYDGYLEADHVAYDGHESSAHHHQPYSPQKQQSEHDRGSARGRQHSSYSLQEPKYHDQSYDQSYAPQHEHEHESSGNHFDTQQGGSSQVRQRESQQGRGKHSQRGGSRLPYSTTSHAGLSDASHRQASPYNAVPGWDENSPDPYWNGDSKLGDYMVPATQVFDASQFRAPIQADIRPRGSKQKGMGRSQQQPYRPDKAPSLSKQHQVCVVIHASIKLCPCITPSLIRSAPHPSIQSGSQSC